MLDKYFHYTDKQKKHQIILTNLDLPFDQYVTSIENRSKVYYDKIPHYVIKENGDVVHLLTTDYYSNFYGDEEVDTSSIFISIENMGWLKKEYLTGQYINWFKDIYKDEPFVRSWRSYTYWAKYPDVLYDKISDLIIELVNKHNIVLEFIGHCTKINNVQVFNGITTRSNYSELYTDVTPAFDFEKLKKLTYEKSN